MGCKIRKLRATMCGSIEFPADQVPRKAGDKIRFWILPPTMFTQVLTKSKLRKKPTNHMVCWFFSVVNKQVQSNSLQIRRFGKQQIRSGFECLPPAMFTQVWPKSKIQMQKNTKSYVNCKHANTIEFPADQACLGKQKIRRAVHHRQQQVCTKLMMFYWVCNNLVNK